MDRSNLSETMGRNVELLTKTKSVAFLCLSFSLLFFLNTNSRKIQTDFYIDRSIDQKYKRSSFTSFGSANHHIAVVLVGLTFRTASQAHNRDIDENTKIVTENSKLQADIGKQWHEIRSQRLFGRTDLYIRTKPNKHTEHLFDMFSTPNISIVNTDTVDDYDAELLKKLQSQYDGVFFTRPDLLFKSDFLRAVDALNQDAVIFPFVTWDCLNKTPKRNWRVADTFMYVPKQFMQEMSLESGEHEGPFQWRSHNGVDVIPEHIPVRTLVPSHHDSDSYKDWNPFYIMNGREEHALVPPVYDDVDCWGDTLNVRKKRQHTVCHWPWC